MKQNIFWLASLLLLVSCSKQDLQGTASSAEKSKAMLTKADFESRTRIFNAMPASERFQLWKEHLREAATGFAAQGAANKAASVNELLAELQESVFEQDSYAADVFTGYFLPAWASKASKIFDQVELYKLTFDPTADVNSLTAPGDVGTGLEDGVGCFCHVGNSGYSCRTISVSIPLGVTIKNGICENTGACTVSNLGCGFLWLSSCNGNHCNFG